MTKREFFVLAESTNSPKFRIQPDDFDFEVPGTLGSTFGKSEVETIARRLIMFFQSRGFWCQFSLDELARFYKLKGWDFNTAFFGLIGGWYDDCPAYGWSDPHQEVFLAFDWEGRCYVTNLFVERCGYNLKKEAA